MPRETKEGSARAWALSALTITLILLSGCFDVPLCEETSAKQQEWHEPGLYDRFPAEGIYGNYHVRESPEANRGASAQDELGNHVIDVNRTDWAFFQHVWIGSPEPAPDAYVAERLNDTFSALGLGTPSITDWSFERGRTGC